MEVVLLERIEKLGQMGDVVNVKTGYARNFLLPKNKALRATKENLARFETTRAEYEAHNLERRSEAEGVAEKMAGTKVILVRQASDMGQLYGSANARDIADAVGEAGLLVDRQQIVLDRPIKTLGIHEVRVMLHPEVLLTVEVNVARSLEEAERQEGIRDGSIIEGAEDFDDDDADDGYRAGAAPADDDAPTEVGDEAADDANGETAETPQDA